MLLFFGLINEMLEVHRCLLKKSEEKRLSSACNTNFNGLDFFTSSSTFPHSSPGGSTSFPPSPNCLSWKRPYLFCFLYFNFWYLLTFWLFYICPRLRIYVLCLFTFWPFSQAISRYKLTTKSLFDWREKSYHCFWFGCWNNDYLIVSLWSHLKNLNPKRCQDAHLDVISQFQQVWWNPVQSQYPITSVNSG